MGKKFISVTLDLDEETHTILERASAKRGSTVSQVAQELISRALRESVPSREDTVSLVEQAVRAMGPDTNRLSDQLLALTQKDAPQETALAPEAVDVALLVLQAGTKVFGSDQGFLEWLSYPLPTLGDKTPLSLLSSPAGLQMVIDELGRMKPGEPS